MTVFAERCWFLTGPTASGKTEVALALARLIDAEIVSMDSMTLYRGMDIGTAKPTPAQRAEAPHHLLDILEPYEEFSLAQYLEAAAQALAAIESRGRRALFVGGTALYLKGLLRGVFEGPGADWALRAELARQAAERPSGWLHAQLAAVDPQAAERLHPNDHRRLIRAIEVYRLTGAPISRLQGQFDRARQAEQCRVFVLHWPRETLHQRIDQRVDAMIERQLAAEVAEVHAACARQGRTMSRTAMQALGYRELTAYLQGQCSLAEAVAAVKAHTRQFAKRQDTWFRSLSECRFVRMTEPCDADQTARRIADAAAHAQPLRP